MNAEIEESQGRSKGRRDALSEPVHVVIGPLGGRLTVEIGYRTPWDCEHTLGARFVDWQLVELNGSVTGH